MDHEWSWSNILTVLLLVIVAVVEALQQALSQAPTVTKQLPVWVISPNWNYVPLALLIIAGVIWFIGLFPTKARQHDPVVRLPNVIAPMSQEGIQPPVQQQINKDLDTIFWPLMAYQPPSERIFVEKAPQELTNVFKTYIDAQAEKLIQPYMGKWLRLAGAVTNASQISGKFWQVFLHLESDSLFGIQIVLYFANTWTEHLSLISRGTNINVIGRISKVSASELDLQACELDTVNL